MKKNTLKISILLVSAVWQPAFADLSNGTFESGLTGWTASVSGSAIPIVVASGSTITGAGTIQPSLTNDNYAYTSQTGPGYSLLTQAFTVQSGTNRVFFDIAINNSAGAFATPDSLTYSGAANQQARFEILKPGASPTTTNPADIIVTVYRTQVGDPLTQAWNTKQVDVTSQLAPYVGQNVIFRFSQVDNQGYFNLAIDNVNVGFAQFAAILSTLTSATAVGNTQAYSAAAVIDANANLLTQFAPLAGDNAAISNAVTQTLPLLSGSGTIAVQSSLAGINRVIQARLDANRGMSSGNDFAGNKNFWMKPFGSWADQSDRNGVSGYKANTFGLVTGFDSALSSALRIGGAFAYARSDINSKSSVAAQSADVDVFQLVGYGSYALSDRMEINFQADVGQNTNKGRRSIAFTASEASSDFRSNTAHVGAGFGRTYNLSSQTSLFPSIRADYTWIKDNSYTETGANLLNLNVNSRTTEALVVGIDGKALHQLNDQTTLVANLGIGYDTINKQASVTAAFAGAPSAAFVTYGLDPSPWIGTAGVGVVYKTKTGLEITGRYDAEYRESFLNQTASLKMRWAF